MTARSGRLPVGLVTIDAPGARGLYYPHSRTNRFRVIDADQTTGAVIYEDDWRLKVDLCDVSHRIPLMSLSSFRGIHPF
ncbi:hypothetical protein ACFQY0_02415 [Haloferula chungangensis]|uniref:Uncharacterized protein n=1 Tax=Haloferula chungangensis TaxID=1048331 RepID=A0ABW2L3F7_9BACT